MISFVESSFRFDFGESWVHVEQWDSSRAFANGVGTVQGRLDDRDEGSKALDFVGVRAKDLWLFEVKDFRNRPNELADRIAELPLELALKVRDTVAGIVGRHQGTDREQWVAATVAHLANTRVSATVVAFVAPPGRLPANLRKVHLDVLMKKTKQRLAWFSRRVFVLDPAAPAPVPELTVVALAQG